MELGTASENLKVSVEKLKNRLEYECRPYADLIAEPIIRRKVLMEINKLDQKLKLKQNGQDDRIRQLSDPELEQEFRRIKEELDRRNHDSNIDI